MFGTREREVIGARVRGLVLWPAANQASMAVRSYVIPSEPITGSIITSWVIGQRKFWVDAADIVRRF
jgi:hypothetical protein